MNEFKYYQPKTKLVMDNIDNLLQDTHSSFIK